jgi:general nucleoside transport system permease protein
VSFDLQQIQDILVIIVAAATPLLLAAIGEVVAERAGVLNLGLEGMMIVGAATGFAFAYMTDSTIIGVIAGVSCGVLMSAIFAFLTIGLATNQVAAGLALTIFGRGLANLIGEEFVGLKRAGAPHLYIPGLTDLPLIGRLIFGQDFFVYFAVILTGAVSYWLMRTRSGLTLRAVGENHTSGHSLGVPVRGIRLLAVMFGGACAGLGGCYLSLSYTPFWSPDMTAGRGWIALALVVFASWRPWRALAGAILFGGVAVLALAFQGLGVPIPAQLLNSLPYLTTIVVLIVLSLRDSRGALAPASLGQAFIPDR